MPSGINLCILISVFYSRIETYIENEKCQVILCKVSLDKKCMYRKIEIDE